jgi:hypothetical protein
MKHIAIQNGKHIEVTQDRFDQLANKYLYANMWCENDTWFLKIS